MKELADRIEALTGPDREADHEIQWALGVVPQGVRHAPSYTSSIDAAMTLATDDNVSDVLRDAMDMLAKSYWKGEVSPRSYYRAALPRYICAAALRARHSIVADAPINERNLM